jgi:cell division protein FtsL
MIPPPANDRSPFRQHLWLAAILLLILVAASVMGDRGPIRLYQMHRARAALEQEIEQLDTANAALADEVQAFREDPARIEGMAREELGLVKPGETVYLFQSPSAPAPAGR